MNMNKRLKVWLSTLAVTLLLATLMGCSGTTDTPPQPPAKPTTTAAVAGNTQVSVSWSAVTGATSYNIYYGTAAGVTTGGTKVVNATSPYAITGLTNSTAYYFVVTAVNAGGESALSDEASATPLPPAPAKPSGIVVSGGDTQATVSWTAVSGAASYNIYYGTTAGVTISSPTKVTGVTSAPQTVSGLTNGTPYYFVVTAVNAGGESGVSSEKTATPAAAPQVPGSPTGRVVTSTVAGQLTVTWTAVAGATSYNVYYLQASSQPTNPTVLASTPTTSTTPSASITGLTSGATYYVLITAVNAVGESGTQTKAQAITIF